jgi:hypothetical protein
MLAAVYKKPKLNLQQFEDVNLFLKNSSFLVTLYDNVVKSPGSQNMKGEIE